MVEKFQKVIRMDEEQLKQWNKLKQHCNDWKNGKVLNTYRPLQKKNYQPHRLPQWEPQGDYRLIGEDTKRNPFWKQMKDYTPSLVNAEMLKKNCFNQEQAIDFAIEELKKGNRLSVMG